MDSATYRNSLIQNVSRILAEEREKRGWTVYRLSQESGVSWHMVKFIEDNSRQPSLETIIKLAQALEVPTSKLIGDAEKKIAPSG